MAKRLIFLLSTGGKSLEQVKREAKEAFDRYQKAQEEAEVYFTKIPKPKHK
jgi:predicted RNase H-like HicB family nuclease